MSELINMTHTKCLKGLRCIKQLGVKTVPLIIERNVKEASYCIFLVLIFLY